MREMLAKLVQSEATVSGVQHSILILFKGLGLALGMLREVL